MDTSSKMKINKGTQALNDTLNKMDLIDIYTTFHPKTTEYTFFSSAHGTFSRKDHILGHKSSFGKFKKREIISSIFSNHKVMRVDINYRKKSVKNTNMCRLSSTLLNNQEITEEIKEEIKKYLDVHWAIGVFFSSMLFILHVFVLFPFFFPKLISGLIPLWSEKMLDIIPILLNLLRLVLWSSMWSIQENISCALEKNVYSAVLHGMSCKYILNSTCLLCHLRSLLPINFVWMICPLM